MPTELELFGGGGDAPFSLTTLMINLCIGLALALAVRWHFLRFGSTLSNRDELGGVLPFILLTTVLIITVVKSSLALSLGLVGALSIVRFRTPIKEPEELAYLFIAIAIGLGLGANQPVATVAAAGFILLVMAVFKKTRSRTLGNNLYLSIALGSEQAGATSLTAINQLLAEHASSADLRRFDDRDGMFEATYLVALPSTESLADLTAALKTAYPEVGVTFLDQNGMPGI